MSSLIARVVNHGRGEQVEVIREGAWQELLDWLSWAKDAHTARAKTGQYDGAKERSDTKAAFLEFAAERGVKRGDALALYRRWF